ncbi:MAG: hypothetical protein K2N87_12215 [Eubacterium sp.]|nr:hypothetical protein [Eubacterium sp.]
MFGLITGAILASGVAISKALAVAGMAVQGLKVVGNAIASIAKALGVLKPESNVEEIGDRAMQAEEQGIRPEDFDTYEAWVREIEEEDWGYDPEKNRNMEPEKKILKGVEVSSAVVMEKFQDLPMEDFFVIAGTNPDFFSVDRMEEIGKLADTNPDMFGNVVKYVTGEAKDHAVVNDVTDLFMDIEKSIEPGISDERAYNKAASFYSIK